MVELNLWEEVIKELTVNGFTLVSELTTPGSARARVWVADYQKGTAKPEKVAVKVSSSFLVDGLTSLEADTLDALAEREARVYKNLSAHQNIPAFHYFNTAVIGGLVPVDILAVEYINAPTLLQKIEDGQKLTEQQAKTVLADVLSALNHVHTTFSQPIYHRDIKPSNILFAENNPPPFTTKAYLFDFNFARIGDATRASQYIKNIYYPMDALSGGKPTQSQDLVALGNTIIAALYGLEIEGVRERQHKEPLASLDVEELSISPRLRSFLRKLTTSNPALRYQSAAQALEVLKNLETITVDDVQKQVATITRSAGLQVLLTKLKEEDKIFDYNVPSSLRATLDDDALLDHLRRTYSREEFVIEEPGDVEKYLATQNFGQLVKKKGTYRSRVVLFKSGFEGTIKEVKGDTAEVYCPTTTKSYTVAITDLLILGKERTFRSNIIFPKPIKAKEYTTEIEERLLVRYIGPDSIKEGEINIPDGALGVLACHRPNRKRGKIDILWINQPSLNLVRHITNDKLNFGTNYPIEEGLFDYKDIALIYKNHINFEDLYQACFAAK